MIYIVIQTSGEYDEYTEIPVAVSLDMAKAEKYIEDQAAIKADNQVKSKLWSDAVEKWNDENPRNYRGDAEIEDWYTRYKAFYENYFLGIPDELRVNYLTEDDRNWYVQEMEEL